MAVPAPKKQKYSASSSSRIETYDVDSDASEGSLEGEDDANLEPEAARRKILPDYHPHNGFKRTYNRSSIGTYGSSMFSLQIDELLSKVRPDYERRMVKVENALRKLKAIIERTPSREAKTVGDMSPNGVRSKLSFTHPSVVRGETRTESPQCSNSFSNTTTSEGGKEYLCLLEACKYQCRR